VNPIVHRVYVGSYQRLVGRLFAVCGDLAEAEDLVQEAFARAVQHHHRFAQTDNPRRGCALSQSISPAVAGGGTWWVTGSTACQSDPDRSVASRSPAPGRRHSKGVSACVTSTICSTAPSPAPHAAASPRPTSRQYELGAVVDGSSRVARSAVPAPAVAVVTAWSLGASTTGTAPPDVVVRPSEPTPPATDRAGLRAERIIDDPVR